MPSASHDRPLVSVLVPCFRSARFLDRSVSSALAQTTADLEVVVVDNASDDGTFELARRLAAADPRVRVFRNEENLGPVRNWRRCAELARGRYGALLFSDDWYQPEFLAEALPLVEGDPGVGLAYSTVRVVFEDEALRPRGQRILYDRLPAGVLPSGEFLAEVLEGGMEHVPVSPGCAVMRLADLRAWLATELPDPHGAGYLAHGAGPDLWVYLQACQAYPRLGHLAAPRVNFAAHADNLTWKPGIQAAYGLSRLEFLRSRRPAGVNGQRALATCWLTLREDPRRPAVEALLDPQVLASLDPGRLPGPVAGAASAPIPTVTSSSAASGMTAHPGPVDSAALERGSAQDGLRAAGAGSRETAAPTHDASAEGGYVVTAIVSVYKASRFLRGCLDDLLAQSLHARGGLEIVVVDTGSPEDEGAIVRHYQGRSPHLRYLRTEDRRTIYAAWNLGVAAARGRYLTNANADDRHHPEALERLARVLDGRPEVNLAYADTVWTPVENEALAATTSRLRVVWPAFSVATLRAQCMVGPQPVWRRAVHARYGVFDDRFTSAGDWEFWLRIAAPGTFLKVDEVLGLYLVNQGGAELGNPSARAEAEQVRQRFGVRPEEIGQHAHFVAWDGWAAPGRPAASVVVVGQGDGQALTLAAASVALQTVHDWELVLVDADRSGETTGLVARLRQKAPGARVRVVRHASGPVADAWNAGLEAAAGRFVLPLEPGVLLEPGALEACLAALDAEPTAAAATTACGDAGGPGVGPAATLIHRAVFEQGWRFPRGEPAPAALRAFWIHTAGRGIRAVHVSAPLALRSPAVAPPPDAPRAAAPASPPPPRVKFRVTQGR